MYVIVNHIISLLNMAPPWGCELRKKYKAEGELTNIFNK